MTTLRPIKKNNAQSASSFQIYNHYSILYDMLQRRSWNDNPTYTSCIFCSNEQLTVVCVYYQYDYEQFNTYL